MAAMVNLVNREAYIGVRGTLDLGEKDHTLDWHSGFGRAEIIDGLYVEEPVPFDVRYRRMNTWWDDFRATSGKSHWVLFINPAIYRRRPQG